MNAGCRRFWDLIKINPQKWTLPPWGDEGGGFWVVGLIGANCIYYNDIEDGFNFSSYTEFGRIDDYNCSLSNLKSVVDHLLIEVFKSIKIGS